MNNKNLESFVKGCGLFIIYLLVSFVLVFTTFALFNGFAFSTWSEDARVVCKSLALLIAIAVMLTDIIDQQVNG